MNISVARQPILDKNENIFAYELLFRPCSKYLEEFDGDRATAQVITGSIDGIGIKDLTGGKRGFINFTENLLNMEIATIIPRELLGIEVLESVEPTENVVKACLHLKNKGYLIILDDFVYSHNYKPLIELADIIKVDLLNITEDERKKIFNNINCKEKKLLAEKIEDRDIYQKARKLGFSYFQGFYFDKPETIMGNTLPTFKLNYLRLLKEINTANPSFDRIEEIIKTEISISYFILRVINSPYYGLQSKVESIKQAAVLLGLDEIKKWLILQIMRGIGNDKPEILIINSLIRAKFAELITPLINKNYSKLDLFTMGLFSLIDVFLDRPLTEITAELSLTNDIKRALCERKGYLGNILNLIISYEKGDWDSIYYYLELMDLDEEEISYMYSKAIKQTNQIMKNVA